MASISVKPPAPPTLHSRYYLSTVSGSLFLRLRDDEMMLIAKGDTSALAVGSRGAEYNHQAYRPIPPGYLIEFEAV